MTNLALSSTLQKGFTIYIEGMPGWLHSANLSFDNELDRIFENGVAESKPNGVITCSGRLVVHLDQKDLYRLFNIALTKKGGLVDVTLGQTTAKFNVEGGLSNAFYGEVTLSAQSQIVEYQSESDLDIDNSLMSRHISVKSSSSFSQKGYYIPCPFDVD